MKSKWDDTTNYFIGRCNKCGETYEASSKTDDLEGTNFKCRKVLCNGHITLVSRTVSALNIPPKPEKDPTPRRYN